jgi:plastocyanin
MKNTVGVGLGAALLFCAGFAAAKGVTLTGRVAVSDPEGGGKPRRAEDAVVWLSPVAGQAPVSPATQEGARPRLTQRNKSFQPHILVVPVGSVVDFPNHDPFFHNVFSLFNGRRFDLGLYEAGATRGVRFDKPGVAYIFCNIHAEMSAVVVAVDSPYYGISSARGEVVIPDVPPGRYTLHVWYEGALPETLNSVTRDITVSENSSTLGVFRLEAAKLPMSHKNKYGDDYEAPVPDNPVYTKQ